jgi:hypothetical protein
MVAGQTGRLEVGPGNVRFGSKATFPTLRGDVRFTPESGHQSDEIGTAIAREQLEAK